MRLFAALPLPPALVQFVRESGEIIRKLHKGIRPVGNSDMHITLYFFGEIPEQRAAVLANLMEDPALKLPCFDITLGPLGSFPPSGRLRVLFFHLQEGIAEVSKVYSLFRDLIARNGWPKQADERPFLPHITIARNKFEPVSLDELAHIKPMPGRFKIDRLVLFQSILKPAGAEYIPLKTVMFAAPD